MCKGVRRCVEKIHICVYCMSNKCVRSVRERASVAVIQVSHQNMINAVCFLQFFGQLTSELLYMNLCVHKKDNLSHFSKGPKTHPDYPN